MKVWLGGTGSLAHAVLASLPQVQLEIWDIDPQMLAVAGERLQQFADRVVMQSGAFFSVISPEGAATILYREAGRAPELADSLRITATELLKLGIID